MNKTLSWLGRIITVRPLITLAILLVVTIGLGFGATLRAAPTEGASVDFLPPDSEYTLALNELKEVFSETSDISLATLVFRGDSLTPQGLAQMQALLAQIRADDSIEALLAPPNAIVAPSAFLAQTAGVTDLATLSPEQLNGLLAAPEIAPIIQALRGQDGEGETISVATIRLRNSADEKTAEAERAILEMATASQGPLQVSSISPTIIEDEYTQATESGLGPLIGIALLLIAGLILLFLRTWSDLLLTLTGLIFALTWIVGTEGWLGPNGLGLIGPPSSLSIMVPIIVISLTVDYAIQAVSHYREQRAQGLEVVDAVRVGFSHVALPLILAAVTTVASFFSTLFSPIAVVGDFGVVAGLGVGLSLVVMLTLVPAGRTLIDRRREAKGKLAKPRSVSSALPGIQRAAEFLGLAVSRRPAPYLLVVAAITVWLGFSARGLNSEFSIRDILPRGGSVLQDMDSLQTAVGGSTELASVLIVAEATETRTLLNIEDLTVAFNDPSTRPTAAAGPLAPTFVSILRDWTHASGEVGDNFNAQLAFKFQRASSRVQLNPGLMDEIYDELANRDGSFQGVLVNNKDGLDHILITFPVFTDDTVATKAVQQEIEELWNGDDDAITATAMSILAVAITDQITSGQSASISTTIVVALAILVAFFWVTLRHPVLGFVAVGPVVVVLIWVLGTMALLGIPYSLITSIITALSIGIGVDYTIHMIHRYQEEFAGVRNPEKAAVRTLATTGSALLGSALTTALGFGVLIFSPLEGSAHFGITSAITIGYSLVVSIVVVPPLMTIWGAYQNMRLRSSMKNLWEDLDVIIAEVHDRHHDN